MKFSQARADAIWLANKNREQDMNNVTSIERLERELAIEKAAHRLVAKALMPINDDEIIDLLMENTRKIVIGERLDV